MGNNNHHRLPDTPWHIGYTKKDEDDPRRHKSRCYFYDDGNCKSIKSNRFGVKCTGSSHCMSYAETEVQAKRILGVQDEMQEMVYHGGKQIGTVTVSKKEIEKAEQRSEEYKKIKREKRKNLMKSNPKMFADIDFATLRECKICNSPLTQVASKKECKYCGASYTFLRDNDSFLVKFKK